MFLFKNKSEAKVFIFLSFFSLLNCLFFLILNFWFIDNWNFWRSCVWGNFMSLCALTLVLISVNFSFNNPSSLKKNFFLLLFFFRLIIYCFLFLVPFLFFRNYFNSLWIFCFTSFNLLLFPCTYFLLSKIIKK